MKQHHESPRRKQIIPVAFSVQNAIPLAHLGRKNRVNKMRSINKIGNAALERIFPNRRNEEGGYCTFGIALNGFNLSRPSVEGVHSCRDLDAESSCGTNYFVWGIRLGLRPLTSESQTIFEEIVELKQMPSHIILMRWSEHPVLGRQEMVEVSRLTQEQEKEIREAQQTRRVSWLKILSDGWGVAQPNTEETHMINLHTVEYFQKYVRFMTTIFAIFNNCPGACIECALQENREESKRRLDRIKEAIVATGFTADQFEKECKRYAEKPDNFSFNHTPQEGLLGSCITTHQFLTVAERLLWAKEDRELHNYMAAFPRVI